MGRERRIVGEPEEFPIPHVKSWYLVVAGLAFGALLLSGSIVRLCADRLWFAEVGLPQVFWTTLWARGGMGLACATLFLGSVYANLRWAGRSVAGLWPVNPDGPLGALQALTPILRVFLPVAAVFVGLAVGIRGSAGWEALLLWRHAVPFGIVDPLFGRDIGYFVFTLPVLGFAWTLLFATLSVSLVAVVVAHLMRGGILAGGGGIRIVPRARAHVVALLGALVA
ncbi:MAG: UPF0182 family protein, partial [bacterium]